MSLTLSYSTSNLGSVVIIGPFFQYQSCSQTYSGRQERKRIRITRIKTAYNPFHSHLLHRPSPAQPLLGRYLPRLSSHYSRNFLAETFAKR